MRELRAKQWLPRVTTGETAIEEFTPIFVVPRFASTVDGLKDAGIDTRGMDVMPDTRPAMTIILERIKSGTYKT